MRRLLSRENIYTIKLVTRGHIIPKALHANMFLVRHAEEVMDRDVVVLPAETDFAAFLRQTSAAASSISLSRARTASSACCASIPNCAIGWRAPIPA